MKKAELTKLLAGREMVDGYNYAIYVLKANPKNISALAASLVNGKSDIEKQYRLRTGKNIVLLPYVLERSRSIILPVPFDASLNVITEILRSIPQFIDARLPIWS